MASVHDVVHDGVLFARSVWRAHIWGTELHKPTLIDEQQQHELRHLAGVMAAAADRQFTLSWDTKSYHDAVRSQDGGNPVAEERFRRQFVPLRRPGLDVHPLTSWDITGRCELWYLPGAILKARQKTIRELVQVLNSIIAKRGPRSGSGSWRDSQEYFRAPELCKEFAAGVLNLALAWQMQGHENFDAAIYPSKDFATKGKPTTQVHRQTQAFISSMGTSAIVFSAALGIAHPEQYELTRQSLMALTRDPLFTDIASQWAFAFNVLTIVTNRLTPVHRDVNSGGRSIYDCLGTFGGGQHTVIEFPGMGLRLQYDSGTLLLFSGQVHPHGVSVSRDERVCLALYARKSVTHKHKLRLPQSVRLATLANFPPIC